MNARTPGRGRTFYPVLAGLMVGVLVAGLGFRLAADEVSVETAAGAGLSAGPGTALDGTLGVPGPQGSAGAAPGAPGPGLPGAPGAADPLQTGTGGAGAPGGPSGTGATAGTGGPAARNVASDVGVTATEIRIGITLLSVGMASQFANIPGQDPQRQREIWQAFIDDVNKGGGISGRKLRPFYATADITNPDTGRQACLEHTERYKVFMVYGGIGTCIAHEHGTLVMNDEAMTAADLRKARGLWITPGVNLDRQLGDWARILDQAGKLKGRKLGIIYNQEITASIDQSLVPTLRRLGYSVAYRAGVPIDPSAGPAQSAAQAQQMRAAGVDTVFDVTTFVNMQAFVTAADRQQWRPQYLVNSYGGNDYGLFYSGMSDSWNGTLSVSLRPFYPPKNPEPPTNKSCRDRYNKLTGGNEGPKAEYNAYYLAACTFTGLLQRTATPMGAQLTRAGMVQAFGALGSSFDFGNLGPGSLRPGKYDWADGYRITRWGPDDGSATGHNCTSNNDRCFNDFGPRLVVKS